MNFWKSQNGLDYKGPGNVNYTLVKYGKMFYGCHTAQTTICSNGKLNTYFSIKKDFKAESYLTLEQFHVRKAICKLWLSAHNLLIETGRYAKPRSIPRSEKFCKHCKLNCIENGIHFLSQYSLYQAERNEFYNQIYHINNNFMLLGDNDKAKWLLPQEDTCKYILSALGSFIHYCFEKRNKNVNLHQD